MPEKPSNPISRREFARRAAIASAIGSAVASIAPANAVAAGIVSAGAAQTQTSQPAHQTPPSSVALPPLPANAPRLSSESQAEADARFQTILTLYGSRFSDAQKTDLRRLCVVAQPPLDRLRAYKVENGDGPGLYLKPLFEREKKPKAIAASKPAASPKTSPPATGASVNAHPAAKSADVGKAPASGVAKKP